jgi:hypothetical protein
MGPAMTALSDLDREELLALVSFMGISEEGA